MSEKTRVWIQSFRLRTLPLALSSIILGGLLSSQSGFNTTVFTLAIITTLFLQILSNLANDYGDSQNGADTDERIGPDRAVQSGIVSPKEMKQMIFVFVILSLISGLLLLYFAFGLEKMVYSLVFFLIGVASIGAALKYTAGKNPYGYKGFGDLFVLIFFGWVGVIGTNYLMSLTWNWDIILPATSLGLFSVGVLNLNNMRDIENDENVGKRTIPVILGTAKAKFYHYTIISIAWILAAIYLFINYHSWINILSTLSIPLFIIHLLAVVKIKEAQMLDSQLKPLALSTLFFAITFGLSFLF